MGKELANKVHNYLNQFSNRLVRDLAWAIASPPLVSGIIDDTTWWNSKDCMKEFNACLPTLLKVEKDPGELIKHLGQLQSQRLGLYFEGLVAFWLKISPNYQLLNQNIQIIEEGITHGEIDFIVRDLQLQKTIHLEVAVKFYIGSSPSEDPFCWYGTNTKDQLGRKLRHLRSHQTQLSHRYQNHLEHRIDEKHCLIKGRLFYPLNISTSPAGVNISDDHLRGRWEYARNQSNNKNIIPIEKNRWLADLNHNDILERIESGADFTGLNNIRRARCYVRYSEQNKQYNEKYRIFLLPDEFSFPN